MSDGMNASSNYVILIDKPIETVESPDLIA